jgi:hypothetical protein
MHREITFYRTCLNSYGEPYDSPLWSVRIPVAVSFEDALRYAREEFAKFANISVWSELAHFHRTSVI